jgi:hypothetical protein
MRCCLIYLYEYLRYIQNESLGEILSTKPVVIGFNKEIQRHSVFNQSNHEMYSRLKSRQFFDTLTYININPEIQNNNWTIMME